MNKRYILYDEDAGVYLGSFLGLGSGRIGTL
jgi:hypothetical protein